MMPDVTMTTREIKFTSVYEDGDEVENVEAVDVREPWPGETSAEYNEALRDQLWLLTGTGRERGHACYWAESVDGLGPAINLEWC